MKDKLTMATIRAIEERRGIQGVSLRAVAKEAGCSHVNAYHYADGLPGLLWLAYAVALDAFTGACLSNVSKPKRGENFGMALARSIAGFAIEREGLYRLLWFEALQGEPSGDALGAITRSKATFVECAAEALKSEGATTNIKEFGERLEILFAYLQGEVALMINNRSGPDKRAVSDDIAKRAYRMWRILVDGPAR